jgi:hypothetical protein
VYGQVDISDGIISCLTVDRMLAEMLCTGILPKQTVCPQLFLMFLPITSTLHYSYTLLLHASQFPFHFYINPFPGTAAVGNTTGRVC